MTINVAINGYGRIGRNILRAFYESNVGHDIKIVALNDLGNVETNVLLETSTNVVASPIASPLMAELVTASAGHIPNTATNTGFSFHRPFRNSSAVRLLSDFFKYSSSLII